MNETLAAILGVSLILFLFVVGVVLYFLPWIIASRRRHKNTVAIAVLNVLAGWSVVGWVAAFIWAFVGETSEPKVALNANRQN